MADITISYKDNTIAEINESGSKKLLTKGKYCEDDISIDYVKSGGGCSEEGYQQGYNDGYSKGSMPIYYLPKIYGVWQAVTLPENTELTIRVQKASDISYAFMGATNLKRLKLISDDSNVLINANRFVRQSYQLEVLDLTEYSRKFGDFTMFMYNATKLKSIIGALDLSECTQILYAFYGNGSLLEDIEFAPNCIKLSIDFASQAYLSNVSIQSIIDGLADLTGGTSQTLTLHNTVGNKLTDTQKATITAKNWILAY